MSEATKAPKAKKTFLQFGKQKATKREAKLIAIAAITVIAADVALQAAFS
jgi:hypothetical protein